MKTIKAYKASIYDSLTRRHYWALNCLHGSDAILNGTILATPHDSRPFAEQLADNLGQINARRAELGLLPISL